MNTNKTPALDEQIAKALPCDCRAKTYDHPNHSQDCPVYMRPAVAQLFAEREAQYETEKALDGESIRSADALVKALELAGTALKDHANSGNMAWVSPLITTISAALALANGDVS